MSFPLNQGIQGGKFCDTEFFQCLPDKDVMKLLFGTRCPLIFGINRGQQRHEE